MILTFPQAASLGWTREATLMDFGQPPHKSPEKKRNRRCLTGALFLLVALTVYLNARAWQSHPGSHILTAGKRLNARG